MRELILSRQQKPKPCYFTIYAKKQNLVQQKKSSAYMMIFDDNSKIIFVKSS